MAKAVDGAVAEAAPVRSLLAVPSALVTAVERRCGFAKSAARAVSAAGGAIEPEPVRATPR